MRKYKLQRSSASVAKLHLLLNLFCCAQMQCNWSSVVRVVLFCKNRIQYNFDQVQMLWMPLIWKMVGVIFVVHGTKDAISPSWDYFKKFEEIANKHMYICIYVYLIAKIFLKNDMINNCNFVWLYCNLITTLLKKMLRYRKYTFCPAIVPIIFISLFQNQSWFCER